MIRRIHHVGIVVRRLDDAYRFYLDTLRLPLIREAEVRDQGVRAALLSAGESEIELLEPIAAGGGVSRFLAARGEGLHHVCFEVADMGQVLRDLEARHVELIDRTPRRGLAGEIAFLHPKACGGVLVELATPPASHATEAWLRLKRLVIGVPDPHEAARLFERLFHIPEVSMNGGPRTMLAVGRGALLMVPSSEVGGATGMVALSMVATDFPALSAALSRQGVRLLRGTGEVTVEPVSSHGVHLHISRYE